MSEEERDFRDKYVQDSLEEIRKKLFDVCEYLEPKNGILTDAVTVVGIRYWNKAGMTRNLVHVVPISPDQPDYVTVGLLNQGLDLIALPDELPDDEE